AARSNASLVSVRGIFASASEVQDRRSPKSEHESANGMVRPCSGLDRKRSWQGDNDEEHAMSHRLITEFSAAGFDWLRREPDSGDRVSLCRGSLRSSA